MDDRTTLGEARAWLRARADDGARCPLCTQFAKVYRRQINGAMVTALARLYGVTRDGSFAHWPTLYPAKGGDAPKLVYWGLVEEEPVVRADGGRAGWWRVTPRGGDFLRGTLRVPKYAQVYDGRCLGLDGDQVDVQHCYRKPFDLQELMWP